MSLLTVAIATLVAISLVYIYFKWCFTYWKRRGVMTVPPTFPFGNCAQKIFDKICYGIQMRDMYFYFKEKGQKYGGYYFTIKPLFVPVDLALIKNILARDFQHFMDRSLVYDEDIDPLSANLVYVKGEKWKRLRSKLSPTFTATKMKTMFDMMYKCTQELQEVLEDVARSDKPFEVKSTIDKLTTNIIGCSVFGLNVNSFKDPDNKFYKFGTKVFQPDFKRDITFVLGAVAPNLMRFLKLPSHNREELEFFLGILKETIDYRRQNNVNRKDFLQLLMELEKNVQNENGLTMEELTAQAYVFFLAGYETSSTTASFLLYEFAVNPDIQENARREIRKVIDENEGILTYEALNKMTYLDQCIQESLRMYPPSMVLNRICTKDYKISSKLTIKKDTVIIIPIWGVHSDPEFYPNPFKFDPSRFSKEMKSTRDPFTFLPFGEGPRICIGAKFGSLQSKITMVSLLKDYKYSVNPRTPQPMAFSKRGFILGPEGGIWLDVEKI